MEAENDAQQEKFTVHIKIKPKKVNSRKCISFHKVYITCVSISSEFNLLW